MKGLKNSGWFIEPHGYSHSNLLTLDKFHLNREFEKSYEIINEYNSEPWLAYPDGMWNASIYKSALKFGFTRLFTINNDTPRGYRYHIDRTLWIGRDKWDN